MAGEDVIQIPVPARSVVDFVTEEDRRYFEDHPQARFYDRAPHPLELWPTTAPAKGWLVRVYQIVPGFRLRCPYREGGRPDSRTVKLIKAMRRKARKDKWSTSPRDDRLEDLHFVGVV